MEKKIQVSTVKMTADVEVINVNSYLVANVVRAFDAVDSIIDNGKHQAEKYDETEKKWKKQFDANGNPVYQYNDGTVQVVEERVYPFLKELLKAFGIEPLTV